ncbi:Trm112 family protein [Brumimicrobium sp.]|uniref:Trm112 family protein n=1 Tax=Brumimicrobium sp. TaxID=2029867 RepID=UPI002616A1AA|nr:Trm112 family protein [uncultured Brumimicrobium sp.]
MKLSLLEKLCCPQDKNELELKIFKQVEDEIIEGIFTCPDCKRYYPIVYGIPIMTPDEYRQKELETPLLNRWGLQLQEKEERFILLNK